VIDNCPNVQEIYTHNNLLTKWEVPLEEMKKINLRVISYSDNPLSLEEEARLDALDLPDRVIKSRVDGDAQEWLDNKYPLEIRASIEKLDISELGLQGDLNLEGFTNLKRLYCSDNELEDLEISDCLNLEYLDCSNNKIFSLILNKNKELQEVNASHNKIFSTDFGGLINLQTLILTANKIDDLELDSLTNLLHLNVGLNNIGGNLDLSNNLKLRQLLCYKNPILFLGVKHLQDLEYLLCHKCKLGYLNCENLKKLEELNCAGSPFIEELIVNGCESLENLDCAENSIEELNISSLPKLKTLSCKENVLEKLVISNCGQLEFLDFSVQHSGGERYNDTITELSIDSNSCANLKELYYSNDAKNVPDWKTFPKLEILAIGEEVIAKDEDGNDEYSYKVEETNILGVRNTKKIEKIIDSPNEYSLDELTKLEEWELKGISDQLRQELTKLVAKKLKEKLTVEEIAKAQNLIVNKGNHPNFVLIAYLQSLNQQLLDQETKERVAKLLTELEAEGLPPLEEDKEDEEDEQEEIPTPKDDDKDEVILSLREQITQLQQELAELKANRANLSETEYQTKKSALESKLEQLIQQEQEQQQTNNNPPTNYWPYLLVLGTAIILTAVIISYLLSRRKKKIS